jgi:hypothetical protein
LIIILLPASGAASLRRAAASVTATLFAAAALLAVILGRATTAATAGLLSQFASSFLAASASATFVATATPFFAATPAFFAATPAFFAATPALLLLAAALRAPSLFLASLLASLVLFFLLWILRLALGKDDRRSAHRLRPSHADRRGRKDGAKNKYSVFCTDHGHFLQLRIRNVTI